MTLETFLKEYEQEHKGLLQRCKESRAGAYLAKHASEAFAAPALIGTLLAGSLAMAVQKPTYADVIVVPGTGTVYVQGQEGTAQRIAVAGDAKSVLVPVAPGKNLALDLEKLVGASKAARFTPITGKDPLVSGGVAFSTSNLPLSEQALVTGASGETTTLYVVGDAGKQVSLDCYNPAGDKVGTQTVTIPDDGVYTADLSALFSAEPRAAVVCSATNVGVAARISGATTRVIAATPRSAVSPADYAILYVAKWLPKNDAGFYLSNTEIRAMINGGAGTQSYAHDLAEIVYVTNTGSFNSVDEVETWLRNQVDGLTNNGELWHAWDPFLWDNHNSQNPGIVLYEEPVGNPASPTMNSTNIQQAYELIKGEFLWRFVMNNPQLYGGSVGGLPNMSFDPTWGSQDPN